MGNTMTNRRKSRNASASNSYAASIFTKNSVERERKGNKQRYDLRSRTLPARNHKRNEQEKVRTLPTHKSHYNDAPNQTLPPPSTPPPPNGETSRVLFLLYLIHRTWNVITDTKSKSSQGKVSAKPSNRDSLYETESNCSLSLSELYGVGGADDSQCCSQYSLCSCSSCYMQTGGGRGGGGDRGGDGRGTCGRLMDDADQNVYNSIDETFSQDSIGERAVSLYKR